jgi:putative FmdB family regulatory protein
MPTYEYECTKCKYFFEELQKITDKPLRKCPKCGGRLRRLITGGAGVIFKGSGFYVTDYKKSNSPQQKEEKKKDLCKQERKTDAPAKKDSGQAEATSNKSSKEKKS